MQKVHEWELIIIIIIMIISSSLIKQFTFLCGFPLLPFV